VRSSPRIAAVVALAGTAGGCDLVFGVDSDAAPCGDESFAAAGSTTLFEGEAFSVSWAGDRIVYEHDGMLDDQPLPGGTPTPITATAAAVPLAIALAPEGDAMFFTSESEPPVLQALVRRATGWQLDAVVPLGATAGAPSAAEFGPRRVLVRLRSDLPEVQEYEADGDRWQPVGEVHPVGGVPRAPNLTPSGLDMLYAESTGDDPAVFIAHRRSTDAWFGAPTAILSGGYEFPQLIGRCRTLYALEIQPAVTSRIVRRYDR